MRLWLLAPALAAALAAAPAGAQEPPAACPGRQVRLIALSTDGRYAVHRDLLPGGASGPVVVRDLARGTPALTIPAARAAELADGPACREAAHAECVFESLAAELHRDPALSDVAFRRLSMWAARRELYPAREGRADPAAPVPAAEVDVEVERVRLTLTRGERTSVERVDPRRLAPDRDADVRLQGFYFGADYAVALVQLAHRRPDCAGAGTPRFEDRAFAFAYPAAPRAEAAAPPAGPHVTRPPRTFVDAANPAEPYVLVPFVTPPGYAYRRFRLSTGDIVQMHSGCGAYASGGSAFLVQARGRTGAVRLVTFDGGPARELASGYLLVESRRRVGSLGEDAPPDLPGDAQAPLGSDDGTLFATRVLAVELATGKVRDAGWDTFAPVSAGAQRFAVLARARLAAEPGNPRGASELLVFDLRTGRTRRLGATRGAPDYRLRGGEVLARLGAPDDPAWVAVDGATGKVRPVAPDVATAHPAVRDFLGADPPPNLALMSPLLWYTSDGRPIHVPETSHDPTPHVPLQGRCGLDGPFWSHGLLFSDEGIFFWPSSLSQGASDPGAAR